MAAVTKFKLGKLLKEHNPVIWAARDVLYIGGKIFGNILGACTSRTRTTLSAKTTFARKLMRSGWQLSNPVGESQSNYGYYSGDCSAPYSNEALV